MIDLQSALRLYLIVDPEHCRGDEVSVAEAAIAGGVTMVQLRAKRLSDMDHSNLATPLQVICSSYDVPFLVNDCLDIALATGADGVHLGVSDLPTEAARSVGGSQLIIGFSPETDDQLRSASSRGASYLGIGPVFGTVTKADAGNPLGVQEFTRRVRMGGLPAVGIGGINAGNAGRVLATGAAGVAVVSAILDAADPTEAARQLSRNS